MTGKQLPITRLSFVFTLLVALIMFSAITGCKQNKPVKSDPSENTESPSRVSPIPAEITPEPDNTVFPEFPSLPTGSIILPPMPVDDSDDEFEPTPQPTGEPEPMREPEPTQESEPTQEPEPTEPEPTQEPEPVQSEEPTPTSEPDDDEILSLH